MPTSNCPKVFNPLRDYCYIAIDWGAARLKAYLCCVPPNGNVELLDEAEAPGVQGNHEDFTTIFLNVTRQWREENGLLPVFMGGKIGSTIGWKKTPYIPCPVVPVDIASGQVEFDCEGQVINVIPGISCLHDNGNYDLMRSGEVQVLGWLEASAAHRNGTYLLCLPGTHTKWLLVKDGIIQMFKTAVTGEMYDLLSQSSILLHKPSEAITLKAFDEGATFTSDKVSGNLLHGLFSVRSKQLFEKMSPDDASSYLSGLLIGSDVRAALKSKEWAIDEVDEVIIIGESQISDLFERVIRQHTQEFSCFHVKQATVLGFAAIRQRYMALQSH